MCSDISPRTFSVPSNEAIIEEQKMSKNKYLIEAVVYYHSCVFRDTRIGEYHWMFPCFSWATFVHVTRLDQSRNLT